MREPYRTLFDGFDEHWLLARYLTGDEPDWAGIAGDERLGSLSSGETVLLDFAAAWKNTRTHLDALTRERVDVAMLKVGLAHLEP